MTLEAFFSDNKKAALGFSGGVDSSYLLYAGIKYGADIQAYYVKTPFQPQFELNDALKIAEFIGCNIKILEYDILSHDIIAENPQNRCYYCKSAIFKLIQKNADADGYEMIIDGTNVSDSYDDRPGMRALSEIGVRSPLRECGLTKDDIRILSREAGLFTYDKPAYACLATRFPAGTKITKQDLICVEKSENCLFKLGFSDFRVRIFSNAARLQFKDSEFMRAAEIKNQIVSELSPYFENILFDTKTR